MRNTELQKPTLWEQSPMSKEASIIQLCSWVLLRLSQGGREYGLLATLFSSWSQRQEAFLMSFRRKAWRKQLTGPRTFVRSSLKGTCYIRDAAKELSWPKYNGTRWTGREMRGSKREYRGTEGIKCDGITKIIGNGKSILKERRERVTVKHDEQTIWQWDYHSP